MGEGDGYHCPTVEDHYHKLHFEVLDLAISSIQGRFDQPGYAVYQNLEEVLLKAVNRKDYSTNLEAVIDSYGDDFNESELSTQLQVFSSSFPRNEQSKIITLREILHFLQSLSKGQRVFYKQVCWIARLILVLPSTNAASERSFSAMKRVKTYLRSTMSQPRLNHIMTLISTRIRWIK